MRMVKKAIIPAAGYGTRNLPITKVLPKEMFPIDGKPAIHYIVEEAVEAGIEEILIVVSRNKNLIIDYFDRSLELEAYLEAMNKQHLLAEIRIPEVTIHYVRQPFAQGLGNAIYLGRHFVGNEPFAILLPDDIYICKNKNALRQLIDAYQTLEKPQIGLEKVPEHNLKNYGVIKEERLTHQHFKILDIVEKPNDHPPSQFAVTGRYIFNPSIYTYLDKIEKGLGGEIQLTDAIKQLLEDEECYGVRIEGERFDIGSDEDYFQLLKKIWDERTENQ